jgi:dephospho-CoA kinase
MVFVVGLTGGMGCGKSLASKLFSDLGIEIIDTDIIARKLTQSDGPAIAQIKESFGKTFVTPEGSLDRDKMRDLIFSNNDARLKLEKILHPLIREEAILQIQQAHTPYIIIVVPLLFETKDYENIVQRTLVVDCEEYQQLSRTISRSGLSEQKVKAILATQLSRKVRIQKGDDVIINNQHVDYLKLQVSLFHRKYLMLSENNSRITRY